MSVDEVNAKVETNGSSLTTGTNQPAWLKAELFEKVIKETLADFKRITNFKVVPAVAAGENYGTRVLRIDIDVELSNGETKSVSYIMKCLLDIAGPLLDLSTRTFIVEKEMYSSVMPEFEQMYRDAGVEIKFSPKMFQLETKEVHILLENLLPRGFKNANRQEGLDMEHTKCALTVMAKWHAASAVHVATRGRYSEYIEMGNFNETGRAVMKQMNDLMGQLFLQCISTFANHEIYQAAVEKLHPQIIDELFKVARVDPNEFNVLNHGDYWCNNIMFQTDAFGHIKDTYAIDFQMPKYSSPAQDLYYFLFSSTKFENKLHQFDFYIKHYHDHLVENLKLLKYPKKIPTLKDVHILLYKYSSWAFMTVTTVMAGALLDHNENANLENAVGDTQDGMAFKRLLYSNPRYRKHVEVILPWLLYRGGLEC